MFDLDRDALDRWITTDPRESNDSEFERWLEANPDVSADTEEEYDAAWSQFEQARDDEMRDWMESHAESMRDERDAWARDDEGW